MSEIQQDEQEQIKQRRSKLNELRANGGIPFPTDFRRNVVAGELLAEYGEKSKEELEKLVKGYRKVSGAKKIAAYMTIDQNYSHSFNCFISGVSSLTKPG